MSSKKCLVDRNGIAFPYHKDAFAIAYGESVRLHVSCSALWETNATVNVLWFVNGRYLDSNMGIYNQENNIRNYSISSKIHIDFIDNSGFGDYTCLSLIYENYDKKVSFEEKMLSYT